MSLVEVNELAALLARDRAAELADLPPEEMDAVQRVVARGLDQGWTDEQMRDRISNAIGLSPRYAVAVENYRTNLLQKEVPPGRADRLAKEYAGRLRSYRAMTIARTETQKALNDAQREIWKQQQEDGELSKWAVRVFRLNKSEKNCPVCKSMNGRRSSLRSVEHGPPLHPNCACSEELVDEGILKALDYKDLWFDISKHGDKGEPGYEAFHPGWSGLKPGMRLHQFPFKEGTYRLDRSKPHLTVVLAKKNGLLFLLQFQKGTTTVHPNRPVVTVPKIDAEHYLATNWELDPVQPPLTAEHWRYMHRILTQYHSIHFPPGHRLPGTPKSLDPWADEVEKGDKPGHPFRGNQWTKRFGGLFHVTRNHRADSILKNGLKVTDLDSPEVEFGWHSRTSFASTNKQSAMEWAKLITLHNRGAVRSFTVLRVDLPPGVSAGPIKRMDDLGPGINQVAIYEDIAPEHISLAGHITVTPDPLSDEWLAEWVDITKGLGFYIVIPDDEEIVKLPARQLSKEFKYRDLLS